MPIKDLIDIYENNKFFKDLEFEVLELLFNSKDQLFLNNKPTGFYTDIVRKFNSLGPFEDAAIKELVKGKVIKLVTDNEATTHPIAESILNSLIPHVTKKENAIPILEKMHSNKQAEILVDNLAKRNVSFSRDEFRRLAGINQEIYYFADQIGLSIFI